MCVEDVKWDETTQMYVPVEEPHTETDVEVDEVPIAA